MGSHVFVNVPTADQIVVVDRTSMSVVGTWPVTTPKANFPMAIDEADHRLIVGWRRPAKALVYDTSNGKEVASFDIVGDTDDLFYDVARKRLYISGGEGFTTSLFVGDLSRLYLALPHRGSQKAEVRIYEARRP
jgi:hypothetical protein